MSSGMILPFSNTICPRYGWVPLIFSPFLNLSESCREKDVLVQGHNASLHSKLLRTALKLTPKGLDKHTELALNQNRASLFFDSEKF